MVELLRERLYAFIVDFLIVTAVMYILTVLLYPAVILLNLFSIYSYWLPLLAVITLLYFSYLEYHGGTPGKRLQGLMVVSEEGDLQPWQVVLRNMSKVLWLPLAVDVLLGYLLGHLRILDTIARTAVIRAGKVDDGGQE
ncbi:RDD family protein [Methanothermobacter thermautotrophicus]|jgi:uncharacterized RDD family membrane protein YckC|uniref:RDD family protein n=1 Tax=Methanothermobacter thermautotrophicus TaxID=145262 RepID=A0A842YLW9_METTF|nr:RDD family protein [Methanothermobacter thermautotrophicus]MBE2899401.1 RDD family protein [Methanothermobacter thermautotrophicus]MCQ8904259.1 RDD family protein [Methanothermobacter sp.]